MCLNPLKGFIDENGVMFKVANKYAQFVRYERDRYKVYYDMSMATDGDITEYIDVPCRSCPECYEQMRKQWISRATAEMQLHTRAMFITFTYRDYDDGIKVLPPVAEMVTDDGEILTHQTLRYRDFQLFMKRLRKAFPDRKIRFMVCGEYGSRTFRPHYHAIIYDLCLADFPDMLPHNRNSQGDYLYSSVTLDNLWTNGYTLSSDADNGTIAYVAGYVAKKFTALKSKEWYGITNVVAPFIRSSNKPGLGKLWFELHKSDFRDEYDYKVLPATNSRSTPTTIRMVDSWRRSYLLDIYHGLGLEACQARQMHYVRRRVELIDKRFKLLSTDKEKLDYISSQNVNFRKRWERKRGVY